MDFIIPICVAVITFLMLTCTKSSKDKHDDNEQFWDTVSKSPKSPPPAPQPKQKEESRYKIPTGLTVSETDISIMATAFIDYLNSGVEKIENDETVARILQSMNRDHKKTESFTIEEWDAFAEWVKPVLFELFNDSNDSEERTAFSNVSNTIDAFNFHHHPNNVTEEEKTYWGIVEPKMPENTDEKEWTITVIPKGTENTGPK